MRSFTASSFVAAFTLCAWTAAAEGGIEVEVGNGDKVTGTIDPADESEIFYFRAPQDAVISVKAKALKRGPALDVSLYGPDESPLDFGTGKSVALTDVLATEAGLHSVVVWSEDLESTGDYSLSISWKVPTQFSDTFEVGAGETETLFFTADEGSTVTLSVKPAKKSPAEGALDTLTPPEGDDVALLGAKIKQQVIEAGDYFFTFSNVGDEDGALVATAKIKPLKIVKRKIALTSRIIGSGNPEGDTAFASVLGLAGGFVGVPEIDEGDPGFELLGSSVSVPANALSSATAIIIATAPPLDGPGDDAGAGPTVFFGPEGAKFDAAVTVTIPYDGAFDSSTDLLVIYTRDAKGKITPVPPPYTFDTENHTVSFATSHFSSFRAVMPAGSVETVMLTLASGLGDPRDVCLSFQQDNTFLVANGFSGRVVALQQSTVPPPLFTAVAWAGGGALTADGSAKEQFDFGGEIKSVAALSDGTVWVATPTRIFRVATDGTVTRLAGSATSLDSGDDGPAVDATFVNINSIVVAEDETVYIADRGAFRIRAIDGATQVITGYAGFGVQGLGSDGIALELTNMLSPTDIAIAEDGGLYVTDAGRVRHLTRSGTQTLVNTTIAGSSTGATGSTGDGGSLLAARFESLSGISVYFDAFDPSATKLVVSDEQDATIRVLDLDNDVVTLIAGQHGQFGDAPDFSPADGLIATPLGLTGESGVVTFVDAENGKIRWRIPTGP